MTSLRFGMLCLAAPSLLAFSGAAMAQDPVFVSGTGQSMVENEDYLAPVVEDDDEFNDVADSMSDPELRDDVSRVVERATGAILDLPVGRFADVMERARPGTVDRRLRRDATVADLADVDSRRLSEELGDRSRETIDLMSGFARAMAAMMPEIRRMGDELQDSVRDIRSDVRYRAD